MICSINILATRGNIDEFWELKKIRFYDCLGVGTEEASNIYYVEDPIKTITGCIKKYYKVMYTFVTICF